jgi:WD40 repeat protein
LDGKCAVSVSRDRTLKTWDLENGRLIATFRGEGSAQCCALVNTRRIMAADAVGCIYILSLEEAALASAKTSW